MNFIKYSIGILLLIITKLISAQTISKDQTILPLEFNTGNPAPYGMPSTTISIQNKEMPIILDTGAMKSEIVLSKHALKDINVTYTGTKTCFNAAEGKICQAEFIIPEVKIGSFVIKNVKGSVMQQLWDSHHNEGFKSTEASENGIIGLELLSKFNLLLDYPDKKAVLIRPNLKPLDYDISNWVPIHFYSHLLSQIKINGKLMTFGWDTGSIPSIIKRSSIKEFKQVACPSEAPYAKTDCTSIVTHSIATKTGQSLPNSWFKVRDIPSAAPFDGLFGANFFADRQIYFDFHNHLIYVNYSTYLMI